MLSFQTMKSMPPANKLVTVLLLCAFLATGAGYVFGYAFCLGEDGRVAVNALAAAGCCDAIGPGAPSPGIAASSVSPAGKDRCGLCVDFSTRHGEAVFLKRLKRASSPSPGSFPPVRAGLNGFLQARGPAPKAAPQTFPGMSQALLLLSTVVLLN